MRPGRAQRETLAGGEREQAPAALALAGERVLQVAADPRDDLDLRGDQLAGDALPQQPIIGGERAQTLEARGQFERARVEDRELLLDADRQVGCSRERLGGEV